MIVGHFATALVPRSKMPGAPFWLLLLASNLADLFLLTFIGIGLETAHPESFMDVSFQNLHVDTPYSHDLVPNLILALAFGLLVLAVYRRKDLALWCGGLVFFHLLCDLVVGFPHYIMGPGTPVIGMALYYSAPHFAIILEAIMGGLIVFWFVRREKGQGRALSRGQIIALYVIFVGGALVWLPNASQSLNDVIGAMH